MAILISFVSIGSQVAKKLKFEDISSISSKIITGIISGTLGCILMIFSVKVNDNTIIDFRNVAIIMSAIFGGALPVYISGIVISIFRITYFGINLSSILGVIVAIINSVGCYYIGNLRIKTSKKWIYATTYILITSSIALSIVLQNRRDFYFIIIIYWISYGVVSTITYWYVSYCLAANKLFHKLQNESSKDFLTGLNNVRQFDFLLNNAIKNCYERGEYLSILMIDIDYFKKVNDTYGHIEGDIILRDLGKIISECCRSGDEVSRNGGEEFSILLFDCPNSLALDIAHRIRKEVEGNRFNLSMGETITITVSIGVASYPETTKNIDKLIEKADNALYDAKRSGRNRVCSL
jgi:diguanylate cyclase